MSRRLLPRFVGALGALALVTSAGGMGAADAAEPGVGPPVTVDVALEGGTTLVGTIACEADLPLTLRGSVHQTTALFHAWGVGMISGVACGPEPVPFTIALSGGGVLVPGPVKYSLGYDVDGSEQRETFSFEATHDRTTELWVSPPDGGPAPITISPVAGVAGTGPVAEGTITCSEPLAMDIDVRGWQGALELTGEAVVECDGTTPFAVPFTSAKAQLVPGPATVNVQARPTWPHPDDVFGLPPGTDPLSTATAEVELRNRTPEPDFSVQPTPGSKVRVGIVRRVGTTAEVNVVHEGCDAGNPIQLEVAVRPLRVEILGRWVAPGGAFIRRGFLEAACTGGEQRLTVPVADVVAEGDVVVSADMGVFDGQGRLGFTNAATVSPK